MSKITAFLSSVLVLLAPTVSEASRVPQHVTLIGDSAAGGIPGYSAAIAILGRGIDLDIQVAACRTVDGDSCPIDGVRPLNVVQLANSMGSRLGPNVVVAVGYNDPETQYAQSIENALAAFMAAGVEHVYWLTLRTVSLGYASMNNDITTAATKHPELGVIDWNTYSRGHDEWFRPDGLHPLWPASRAMAKLIHQKLVDGGAALEPVRLATSTLPVAHTGKSYGATLVAAEGVAPYRWALLTPAPKGLHLSATGAIVGKPLVRPGTYILNVLVKDATGSSDRQGIALLVAP
jgi:hypothetical protein